MPAQQATRDELEKARQILAYALKEVSVVDVPANKRPFAVLKRRNDTEDHMSGAFITEDQVLDTLSADVLDEGVGVTKNDTPEAEGGEDATTETDQEGAETEPETESGEQVAKAEGDSGNPIEEFASWLKEAAKTDGAPREAISQVAKILAEMKKGAETEPAEGNQDPEPADTPTVQVFEDGRVIVAGARVDKAGTARRFTTGRTKKIAEMVTSMVKLLQEVDEEAFKALVSTFKVSKAEGDQPATEPAEPTPEAADDRLDKLVEKFDTIAKKLDEIESARAPSKAADDDETAGKEEPVEKKGGLWKGVLW